MRRTLLVIVLLAAVGSCTRHTLVDRADWGAITWDATIRITDLAGTQRLLTEVAVFTDVLEGTDLETDDRFSIPLDSIEYLEHRSSVGALPILAAIAAGVAAIAIIDASGRSGVRPARVAVPTSCPFLYSFDGESFVFDSETFAGAVTRGLERTDLDNLDHLRAVDGTYRLLLTNERPETEYTDELALVVVDHPEGSTAYPDARGVARLLVAERTARSVSGLRGGDFTAELAAVDGNVWAGDPVEEADLSVDSELRDGVVMTFDRPDSDRALLAIHAQNTALAPMALQMFLELQGEDLVQWYRSVDHDPAAQARLRQWVAREGTLHVSVWVDGDWQLQDMLIDVGPLLPKTQVASLDLSGVEGDEVRIKLETARGLWTLDWAALGSPAPQEPVLARLSPSVARDRNGRDLTEVLAEADGAYFTALEGDTVSIVFDAPPEPPVGTRRTIMARTTGFYHIRTSSVGPSQQSVAERILTEPLFGNRYLLGQLLAEAQGGG